MYNINFADEGHLQANTQAFHIIQTCLEIYETLRILR
jgi:hypothetical protein